MVLRQAHQTDPATSSISRLLQHLRASSIMRAWANIYQRELRRQFFGYCGCSQVGRRAKPAKVYGIVRSVPAMSGTPALPRRLVAPRRCGQPNSRRLVCGGGGASEAPSEGKISTGMAVAQTATASGMNGNFIGRKRTSVIAPSAPLIANTRSLPSSVCSRLT